MGKVGFVEKKVWEPNCWINVVSPTQDDLRYLIDEMGIPEAFIDDVEDVDERSRLEVEDGWTLMILRIPFKSVDTSIPHHGAFGDYREGGYVCNRVLLRDRNDSRFHQLRDS